MLYYARTIVNTENTKFEPTGKGGRLMLWNHWWNLVCELRSACARTRTFLWMALCLAGAGTGMAQRVRSTAWNLDPECIQTCADQIV